MPGHFKKSKFPPPVELREGKHTAKLQNVFEISKIYPQKAGFVLMKMHPEFLCFIYNVQVGKTEYFECECSGEKHTWLVVKNTSHIF